MNFERKIKIKGKMERLCLIEGHVLGVKKTVSLLDACLEYFDIETSKNWADLSYDEKAECLNSELDVICSKIKGYSFNGTKDVILHKYGADKYIFGKVIQSEKMENFSRIKSLDKYTKVFGFFLGNYTKIQGLFEKKMKTYLVVSSTL